jgi:hypothetical protein
MLDIYRESGAVRADKLIEQAENETIRSALSLIATIDWGDLDVGSIVAEYKRMILNQKRDRRLHELKRQLVEAEKSGQVDRARELGQEIKYLLEKRT